MAERGMLFSGPLVRAILDGRKKETRRPMNPQPKFIDDLDAIAWDCTAVRSFVFPEREPEVMAALCPIATKGDTIYVRETWQLHHGAHGPVESSLVGHTEIPSGCRVHYDASGQSASKWRPSIHMPRWASRIDLRVTEIRAERVQEITEAGAKAEGVEASARGMSAYEQMLSDENGGSAGHVDEYKPTFARVWDSIYSTRRGLAWGENPWVWVVKFEVAKVRS